MNPFRYLALVGLLIVGLLLVATGANLTEQIHSSRDVAWRASRSTRFDNFTSDEHTRHLFGTLLPKFPRDFTNSFKPQNAPGRSSTSLQNFDSRDSWPQCVTPVVDQGNCGSDWAIIAASVFSDRVCIHSHSRRHIELSAQHLVDCDHTCRDRSAACNDGCTGGSLPAVWKYLSEYGTVNASCRLYRGRESYCSDRCDDGNLQLVYRAQTPYAVTEFFTRAKVQAIQDEIAKNGPVHASMIVHQDLLYYESGVYHHVAGEELGGMSVKIVGWGTDDKFGEYWLVAVPLGPSFGADGYMRVRRGTDESGIESNVMAAIPILTRSRSDENQQTPLNDTLLGSFKKRAWL